MRLGKFFGFNFSAHWSVIILMYLVVHNSTPYLLQMHPTGGLIMATFIGVIISAMFSVSILAHELGHALVGRKFGVEFDGITLFALGGLAKMKKDVDTAKSEFLMAAAGPLMSLAIGAALLLVRIGLSYTHAAPTDIHVAAPGLVGYVETVVVFTGAFNLMLAFFNGVFPLFPLDAGRILRSIIWGATKNRRLATRIAGSMGVLGGVSFVVMGALMVFGFTVPFFGTGLGGIWTAVIGLLLTFAARDAVVKA